VGGVRRREREIDATEVYEDEIEALQVVTELVQKIQGKERRRKKERKKEREKERK